MGYRGKIAEQNRARDLRAEGWTLNEIAAELGVAKSSVSLWCRDVEINEEAWRRRAGDNYRRGNLDRRPSSLKVRKEAEIESLLAEGRERVGRLSDREFLVAGVALYAGEGSKTDRAVAFANSDPRMHLFFISWLRRFFDVDESRLRVRLYLHDGLDLPGAQCFWSDLTGIPIDQFGKPYRAMPDPSIRVNKHPLGCPRVDCACSRTHRAIMGLVHALLTCDSAIPG